MATETITQITQPPEFIEAESKLYLDQLRNAIGGVKGADLSKILGPQFVAGMDPLTQQAMGKAGGLGAYEPYLQTAAGLTGPTAYQAYQDLVKAREAEYVANHTERMKNPTAGITTFKEFSQNDRDILTLQANKLRDDPDSKGLFYSLMKAK